MQVSGGYLIDPYVDQSADLLFEPTGEPYSCTLNQTDISANANKFYIMQALKLGSGKHILFIRYGRIGEKGTKKMDAFDSEVSAKAAFITQFKSKTGNTWGLRGNFVFKPGKYSLMQTDKVDLPTSTLTVAVKTRESTLDPDVQQLLRMFTDTEMLKQTMVSMNIDSKKMPLGKINVAQLDLAKKLLIDFQKKCIELEDLEDFDAVDEEITRVSSRYYTLVPYSCGRRVPPAIDSLEKVAEMLDVIEDLQNISVNVSVTSAGDTSSNALDSIYAGLDTHITPVPKRSDIWDHIDQYIRNSHGGSHHFKLKLLQIYEIARDKGRARYRDKFQKLGQRELLIHGSRMCNWVSILKNGLLLDPSKVGAVITGKMFGYGIYFANSFSKSAQYCSSNGYGSRGGKEIICFTLAEVALGKQHQLKSSDSSLTGAALSSKGFHSTWGMGQSTPSNITDFKLHDSETPLGIPNHPLKPSSGSGYSLMYDEKIVYDQDQFDLRFLVIAEMG